MARIELRDATIRIKDGFGGSALVNDTTIAGGNTNLEIDTLSNMKDNVSVVPVGARFTIDTVAATTFTVTGQNSNERANVDVGASTTGNFTLTFSGQTTANIVFNATAGAVQSALEALSNINPGDVSVTGTGSSADPWVVEFTGQYAGINVTDLTGTDVSLDGVLTVAVVNQGAITWQLTFTPSLDVADLPADNDVITFLPQQIEVKVGDGNLTYTENKEYEYELDRGDLDTVREGNQVPLDLSLDFVYEFVTTGTGETITPRDALKGVDGAVGWFSSSVDSCEPYSVDVEVEHNPPCGTAETETTLFPDFRHDTLEFDLSAASISASGRCNAVEPVVARG